jgi:hypothetical protein
VMNYASVQGRATPTQANEARERLSWQMIAHGMMPSQGWRIAERTTMQDGKIHYHCWAVHPRIKPCATTS